MGLIAMKIAQAIERGETIEDISTQSKKWVENTQVFVSAKTLKYFIKGGRVSPLKGYFSRMLNINPIVSINAEGKSYLFGKAFSQKSNMNKVMKHLEMLNAEKKISDYIVLHAQNEEAASWYADKMQKLSGEVPTSIVNISPAIGINAGPGAVAVAVMQE
jgi:hypothetical protein